MLNSLSYDSTVNDKTSLIIIMINIYHPLSLSHKHAFALMSVMLILIIVNHFCILDSFGAEMKKLRNKFVISSVLT